MTLQDMRILVIDDSENMRKLVRAILRGFGINQVDEASSGAEGLQILYDANPNVVITDLNMKPMDGLELVRIIRMEAILQKPCLTSIAQNLLYPTLPTWPAARARRIEPGASNPIKYTW